MQSVELVPVDLKVLFGSFSFLKNISYHYLHDTLLVAIQVELNNGDSDLKELTMYFSFGNGIIMC